jgi:hypothetical protein
MTEAKKAVFKPDNKPGMLVSMLLTSKPYNPSAMPTKVKKMPAVVNSVGPSCAVFSL